MAAHPLVKSSDVWELFAELKACSRSKDLDKGMSLHAAAIKSGTDSSIYVASSLVSMYAKCGSLLRARNVFDQMQHRDAVVWNALIFGYAENGEEETALRLFSQMQAQGCKPTDLTYVAAVKACASLAEKEEQFVALNRGLIVHSLAAGNADTRLANSLIDMYSKCKSMADAHRTFDAMPQPTVVSWNALIFGYAENGEDQMALDLFVRMGQEGYAPNSLTFVACLKACATQNAAKGLAIHLHAVHCNCDSDIFVSNTLIDMYAKYGFVEDARRIFDGMRRHDVVSWTALISGYADIGREEVALELFSRMKQCCRPDALTCVAALKACASLATREQGAIVGERLVKVRTREEGVSIHSYAETNGFHRDIRVANTLIDMYANCGSLVEARKVFDNMQGRSIVSWNAMMFGYVENREGKLSLDLFVSLKLQGLVPNVLTFVAAFKSCGIVGALDIGHELYAEARNLGLDKNQTLVTSLVDFYGKCGSMSDAQRAFDSLPTKDNITWTTLMAGYSRQGDVPRVLQLLDDMQSSKLHVTSVTVLCVLAACSHAGLVDEGMAFFKSMFLRYGVAPCTEHYACMADMLCRANRLDEAMHLTCCMQPDSTTWTSVLRACTRTRNVALGRLAFEHLLCQNDKDARAYVLMSSLYRSAQMFEEQMEIEKMRNSAGILNPS